MSKEPSAVGKLIGDFAPKLVDLTDRVLFGDVWERPELSTPDRSLATVSALIAPLVMDEMLIRLLRSPISVRVAQMGFAESSVHRIAKAISWLRANFSQPIKIEELAEQVHMSISSFHEHFRAVTSMSPLQYQKVLRLQEARRLMLSAIMDASAAGQRVGYLSPSRRFFGTAPTKDIANLRHDSHVSD